MELINKLKRWYKNLPEKKSYIEFFTALLTIPVLLTVILLNVTNLRERDEKKEEPKKEISVTPSEKMPTPTTAACRKEVGPVEIVYPQEGELVTNDPLCIDISYTIGEYCSVAWSYRINAGPWSGFTDKSICLYNMSSGDKKFELRVKSIASSDEKILRRNFTYQNTAQTLTPIPEKDNKTATSSAN